MENLYLLVGGGGRRGRVLARHLYLALPQAVALVIQEEEEKVACVVGCGGV